MNKIYPQLLLTLLFIFLLLSSPVSLAKKTKGDKEYSGRHTVKNIEMSMTSKAFSWLSGSPADNEILSVGKSAQFFGFVALRYQSDRTARRGDLGKAFEAISNPEQQKLILDAAQTELPALQDWWQVREQILGKLEAHLYQNADISTQEMLELAQQYGYLYGEVARIEANGCAQLEQSLSPQQLSDIENLRKSPASASDYYDQSKTHKNLNKQVSSQYIALYSKCLSYLTGDIEDQMVIPLGQPAQFFGFVAMRHKSGRGVKRGKLSKTFKKMLSKTQKKMLKHSAKVLVDEVKDYKSVRYEVLNEMNKLRGESTDSFNIERYQQLTRTLGKTEIHIAILEAKTYKQLRDTMTSNQINKMMALRSSYIIDDKKMEDLSQLERGKQLYFLCASCHQDNDSPAPSLSNIVNRQIASRNFEYSDALQKQSEQRWSLSLLKQFIAAPNKTFPGNKMDFSGLLSEKDQDALLAYLSSL